MNLLKATMEDSPELLTGVLGLTVAKFYGPIAGASAFLGTKIIHGALKGQGFQQIAAAFKTLRDQGKIEEDFIDSDLAKACLSEILQAIDQSPDPRRVEAIKNAFVRIAMAPGKTDGEKIYQQQLLNTIGLLSAGEIVLLAAMFRVGGKDNYMDAVRWLNEMARETGFNDEGLVELSETPLIEKRLIRPRTLSDKSGISWGSRNRLTTLGERVCQVIQTS